MKRKVINIFLRENKLIKAKNRKCETNYLTKQLSKMEEKYVT